MPWLHRILSNLIGIGQTVVSKMIPLRQQMRRSSGDEGVMMSRLRGMSHAARHKTESFQILVGQLVIIDQKP